MGEERERKKNYVRLTIKQKIYKKSFKYNYIFSLIFLSNQSARKKLYFYLLLFFPLAFFSIAEQTFVFLLTIAEQTCFSEPLPKIFR